MDKDKICRMRPAAFKKDQNQADRPVEILANRSGQNEQNRVQPLACNKQLEVGVVILHLWFVCVQIKDKAL